MPKLKQLIKTERLEEVIKKSTFIAIIGYCDSELSAKEFIQKHSVEGATHNCWAYKIGAVYRFNDNGEPSGTAGKPMYNAIEGQNFDNTVALVIRHYGGIKLGTGGLMRAYGGIVSRCLQSSEFQPILEYTNLRFKIDFAYVQAIYNLSSNFKAQILNEDYTADGVVMSLKILDHESDNFSSQAENFCKGKIIFLNL